MTCCLRWWREWLGSQYVQTVWVTSQRPEQTNKETSKFRSALQCRALPVPCSNLRTFHIHATNIHDPWAPQHRNIHERISLRRLFKRRRGVAREYYMNTSYDVTWLESCIFAVDVLLDALNICYIKLIKWRRLWLIGRVAQVGINSMDSPCVTTWKKEPVFRRRCIWEDSAETELKEIERQNLEWIQLA
jgi:hypothetical protein